MEHVSTIQQFLLLAHDAPAQHPVRIEYNSVESSIVKVASYTKGAIVRFTTEWRLLLEEENDPSRLDVLADVDMRSIIGAKLVDFPVVVVRGTTPSVSIVKSGIVLRIEVGDAVISSGTSTHRVPFDVARAYVEKAVASVEIPYLEGCQLLEAARGALGSQ